MPKKKELKSRIRALEAELAAAKKEQIGAISSDAAHAIGEEAFYAGYEAGVIDVFAASPRPIPFERNETFYAKREQAWSNYEPSEDVKEMS